MTSNWIRFTRRDCPICAGVRRDCRQSTSTNLIHCRETSANPPGWTFIKEDSLGFGIWAEKAALDERNEQRREEWRREQQQRQKEKQERALKLLPLEQRDRQYRQLPSLAQRYLNEKHRSKLGYRGLLKEEIDFALSQGWLHTWQPGMPVFGLSPDLAGVSLKNGKPTLTGVPGIAIAATDFDGKIAGFQIGADEREKFGKYIWLSSANQGGNGPYLPSGELPLFFWKHPEADRIAHIWFVEGGLKSLITALCLWLRDDMKYIMVVGTPSSGDFSIGKTQVKQVIDRLGSDIKGVSFCPDAGAIENPNLVGPNGGYRKTFALLKELGCDVKIKWWGQKSKKRGYYDNKLDIDEIQTQNKTDIIHTISLDEFLGYIPSEIAQHQRQPKPKNKLIDREEYLGAKAYHSFQSLFKALTDRFKPPSQPETPNSVECSAIVPYRGVTTLTLDDPDNLPTQEQWLAMGQPKIIFSNPQHRLDIYIAAREKGYPAVVDRSNVGMGKSWTSGELKRWHFGLEERNEKGEDIGGRIVYIASDYKNPTTLTVEKNFTELIHRHDGESQDPSRLTPTGKPYRIRTPKGEKSDIPSNCPETETFLVASQEKDALIFGGEDSPICSRCPLLNNCDFLATRKAQLQAKSNLRAHIDSLGLFTEKDIAIVDEPGTLLPSTKSTEISLKDIESLAFRLQRKDPQSYNLVSVFLGMIWDKLSTLKDIPIWGYDMIETLEILAGSTKDSTKGNSKGSREDSTERSTEGSTKDSTEDSTNELTINIWKRYRQKGQNFEHPVVTALRTELAKNYPDADPWEVPGIPELEAQISQALTNNWDEILENCQTPEQKQQAIRDKAILNWLSPLLKAITARDKRINIRITQNGRLELTRRSRRHQKTLQSFGFVLMLDATASASDLVQKTGFKYILEIEQKMPDDACQNLKFRVIKGLGKNPKRTTEETTWKRYYAAIEAVIQKQPELTKKQRAIITFKDDVERFKQLDALSGYWHRDSRGNNRFTEVRQLIIHGLPKPNLADKAAEWQALTGEVVEATDIKGTRYGAWYWNEVISELIQCCGRPRAHLRPDEEIEISLMAGDALSDWDISKLRQAFPGCQIEIVDAYDLAPAAARKGVQKARGMVEAIWDALLKTGTVTREAIANLLKLSPGRISQLAALVCGKTFSQLVDALVFLYKAIKGKTNALEIDEDLRYLAETFLPDLARDLENLARPELIEDVLVGVCAVCSYEPEMVHRILAATPVWVLCKLFGGAMQVAIGRLLSISPPMPEVLERTG